MFYRANERMKLRSTCGTGNGQGFQIPGSSDSAVDEIDTGTSVTLVPAGVDGYGEDTNQSVRIEKIAAGKLKATSQDLNFYAHELREGDLMSKGFNYEEAHKQALKDYGIEYKRGYQNQLYTEEALNAGDEALKKN